MSIILNGWKKEIYSRWDKLNLESICKEFEISFEETFLTPLLINPSESNPLDDLQFTWIPNGSIYYGVLHLHPVNPPTSLVTWEKWFINSDGCHHHVLRNYEFEGATDIWKGQELDHPEQFHNIDWHFYKEINLVPLALR